MAQVFKYLFFYLFFQSIQAFSQEFIGVTERQPGFIYEDGNGKAAGIIIEQIRKFLKELKIKENLQIHSWEKALELAKSNKNYYIFPIVKTPEREKDFKFAGVLYRVPTHLYSRSESHFIIHNIEEAKKYTICVIHNDFRDDYLKEMKFPSIVRFSDQVALVNGLSTKKCDLAISSKNMEVYWAKIGQIKQVAKKVFTIESLNDPRYLAFNKNTDDKIVDAFTKVMNKINKSEKLTK